MMVGVAREEKERKGKLKISLLNMYVKMNFRYSA